MPGAQSGAWKLINTGWLRVDASDTGAAAKAEEKFRRAIPYVFEFLRHYVPGFTDARISAIAERIGCRYSRRFDAVGVCSADNLEPFSTVAKAPA